MPAPLLTAPILPRPLGEHIAHACLADASSNSHTLCFVLCWALVAACVKCFLLLATAIEVLLQYSVRMGLTWSLVIVQPYDRQISYTQQLMLVLI